MGERSNHRRLALAAVCAGDGEGTIPRVIADPDKKTGLDRADEAAGAHGQQGRDGAREKQSR